MDTVQLTAAKDTVGHVTVCDAPSSGEGQGMVNNQ